MEAQSPSLWTTGEGPDSVLYEFDMNLYYRLLQDTDRSPPCRTVGPRWLSILNIAVSVLGIFNPKHRIKLIPETDELW